jgi:hypothetical protein
VFIVLIALQVSLAQLRSLVASEVPVLLAARCLNYALLLCRLRFLE